MLPRERGGAVIFPGAQGRRNFQQALRHATVFGCRSFDGNGQLPPAISLDRSGYFDYFI